MASASRKKPVCLPSLVEERRRSARSSAAIFYDPFFSPYPWWHRTVYPYRYFPVFDNRAQLHIRVAPESAAEAAVYVDGFYAGVIDDFNGVFQRLPLTPGGHGVTLWLSADDGHFVVQLSAGKHRLELRKTTFLLATDVEIGDVRRTRWS